jgi:hypothetical protein
MSTKKRGRPSKPHRAATGEHIDGLYRCPDGRWRITATGERFTEPDEALAVARYLRLTGDKSIKVHTPFDTAITYGVGDDSRATLKHEDGDLHIIQQVSPHVLWPWLRRQIIERPKWVAEQVGIEQIGYLTDLAKPTPSPTLEEVGGFISA